MDHAPLVYENDEQMKVHLRMLGCRLNQAEIDSMARQFQQQEHEIVVDATAADHFVVNTCAVTNEAARSSRKLIRELNRANVNAPITVTGCYSQIAPEDIVVLPGVGRIVENTSKDRLVEQVTGISVESFDHEPVIRDERLPGAARRTRAFVKVQDGCENACTFCVTTLARGVGRSQPVEDVVTEVQMLHDTGFQEVVLTGVHLGSYGYDFGDQDGLVHLIQAILTETNIPRVRVSSLEPWDLSPTFFDLWDNDRLCPHLHLPLQSGCDATLRRMRRNTTQAQFRVLVEAARARIPNLSVTTDVIAGFPGETEAEFETSRMFIESMAFASLHVFPYSVRPGTPAARMQNQVPKLTRKARVLKLRALSDKLEVQFAQHFIGSERGVLWEQITGATQDGFINVGYTDNYVRVRTIHPRVLTNLITPIHIVEFDPEQRQLVGQAIIGG